MTKRNTDFTLTKLDDLFTTQEQRDDAKLERVQNIPLCELHPFKNHPFKVQNDEEMKRMIESIKKVGSSQKYPPGSPAFDILFSGFPAESQMPPHHPRWNLK